MSIRPFVSYAFILIFICWFFGLFIFGFYAYSLKYTPIQQTDAIIVLTGGAERVQTGFRLLQQQKAPLLFITGVNDSVSPQQLLDRQKNIIKEATYLDYSADNTYENALAIKDWTKEQKVKSVLLVTSFYHMPRSLFEISKQTPDIQYYPVPVFINQSTHWMLTRSAWLLFIEYNKFIIRFIQFQIRRIFL